MKCKVMELKNSPSQKVQLSAISRHRNQNARDTFNVRRRHDQSSAATVGMIGHTKMAYAQPKTRHATSVESETISLKCVVQSQLTHTGLDTSNSQSLTSTKWQLNGNLSLVIVKMNTCTHWVLRKKARHQ